jgi:hypothetical protein
MNLLPVLIPFVMAAFVIGMIWLIAHFGGWRELAARYPAVAVSDFGTQRGLWWQRGRTSRWRTTSISLRWFLSYNHCIRWRADDDYLHLRVMPILSLFHPPVSLPWREMEVVSVGRWFAHLRIAGVPLRISPRIVARMTGGR